MGTVDGLLPGLTVVLVVTLVGVVLKDGAGDVKGGSGLIFVSNWFVGTNPSGRLSSS